MRARLSACFLSVVLCLFGHGVWAKPIDQIVVFGDSLSDNGNLYAYMKQQLPVSPPYYQGRFSNGPVWIEELADSIFPSDGASHLLDYAFGGAGVLGPDGDFDDDTLLSLNCEIDSYLLAHQDHVNADALFVIWIGSNNYLIVPDEKQQAIQDVLWGIRTSIQRLIDHGARHFLVLNLPDLGKIPFARELEMEAELSEFSDEHNALLKKDIEQFQADNPQMDFVLFDLNQLFKKSHIDPAAYGFTNITDTCYESVLEPNMPHSVLNMVAHIRPKMRGPHACDGYFFFDPVHPTAYAHYLVGKYVFADLKTSNIELP